MSSDQRTAWVGLDLGGTKMLASVYDDEFQLLGRDRTKTRAADGVESTLERIVKTIGSAIEDAGLDQATVRGIGIGCPGPVDMDRGIVREALNLGWREVAVGDHLAGSFGCPVQVLNDVDAGVYAEYRFGAARDARCVVGVFPGTGIGGGCVYEGHILHGRAISCMEIGHLPLNPGGPANGTDHCRMLEQVSSRLAIAGAAAQAAYRGDAPYLASNAGTQLKKIRSRMLSEAIAAGDTTVEAIVREAAQWIGVAMTGVVHLLAPDIIVLGGGLVEAMSELFVEEVDAVVRSNVLESYRDVFQVVAGELADDASVLGAAAWAQSQAERTSAPTAG